MKIDDKRNIREHKRIVKRAGHKRLRARVREALHNDPEAAADVCDSFGGLSSANIHVDDTPDDT